MPTLPNTRHSYTSDDGAQVLKAELESLPPGSLPLHLATTQGGRVDDRDITVTVFTASDSNDSIRAHIGVFFTEVVGGCNCHDDPIEVNAYGELRVTIDKASAEARFEVLAD